MIIKKKTIIPRVHCVNCKWVSAAACKMQHQAQQFYEQKCAADDEVSKLKEKVAMMERACAKTSKLLAERTQELRALQNKPESCGRPPAVVIKVNKKYDTEKHTGNAKIGVEELVSNFIFATFVDPGKANVLYLKANSARQRFLS